ncbi:MAG TPA: nicotinate phosphoribosyltransferase [Candidatus Hydrogenedentes bacterium]|nr:nicotinate phosphoribosyltransferase [Candidatus Hydrogenedentota bacterium]HOV72811.1 nicotinate phosphoribosyltransferase [Candidatus Hydrogenedentota bacterium]HPC16348.1 nicotinate phosphoribosyltransferase [Candidatus Hydrogenedentota bacterium]HRT20281.1 nicotinate phosphoribosyltransferase [Candidatus Hydrogenedentota bacterium]HRT65006.1 nicotinate phosphoribosyltransferase [Candidatus Hydrogenedentota bacterium]
MSAPQAWFERKGLALLTDLYELTMMAGYLKEGRADQEVTFDYFFRNLPPHAGFAVAAGLGPFLDYLEHLSFEEDDVAYLGSLGMFDADFLDFLRRFKPQCTVQAVPEGTLVFPHEPIVQVSGTIFETQLIETALLNILNYQTLIATKAARVCLAANGDPVLEFGLRRAHGPDGGLSGSRAAYIGGCTSTSNVLAGKVYGIPVSGTHAHSWVMSFPSELEAFRAFARHYPGRLVLLVDTYDTIASGVPNAIRVFRELHEQGIETRPAIRLDSGDLAKLSKTAYRMMIEAGLDNPLIVASNDLEEDLIADLKRQGAKINAWGVGTHLITSRDSPSLNGVYKLVAVRHDGEWMPRIKISSNIEKATDPGRKRLVRYEDAEGHPCGDIICLSDEPSPAPDGTVAGRHRIHPHITVRLAEARRCEDLFQTVFENGRRTAQTPPIQSIRGRVLDQIARLPDEFKRLRNPEVYRVLLSGAVGRIKEEMLENPG